MKHSESACFQYFYVFIQGVHVVMIIASVITVGHLVHSTFYGAFRYICQKGCVLFVCIICVIYCMLCASAVICEVLTVTVMNFM